MHIHAFCQYIQDKSVSMLSVCAQKYIHIQICRIPDGNCKLRPPLCRYKRDADFIIKWLESRLWLWVNWLNSEYSRRVLSCPKHWFLQFWINITTRTIRMFDHKPTRAGSLPPRRSVAILLNIQCMAWACLSHAPANQYLQNTRHVFRRSRCCAAT